MAEELTTTQVVEKTEPLGEKLGRPAVRRKKGRRPGRPRKVTKAKAAPVDGPTFKDLAPPDEKPGKKKHLTSKRWLDPQTIETINKTVNGNLIKVVELQKMLGKTFEDCEFGTSTESDLRIKLSDLGAAWDFVTDEKWNEVYDFNDEVALRHAISVASDGRLKFGNQWILYRKKKIGDMIRAKETRERLRRTEAAFGAVTADANVVAGQSMKSDLGYEVEQGRRVKNDE